MNSRERFVCTLSHRQPDKVPLDLGATSQTGISASALFKLRLALGLENSPVKVHEPAQILGWVDEELMRMLGIDVVGLWNPINILGVVNKDWKPWQIDDATPALVAGGLNFTVDSNGVTFAYPQGDLSVSASMRMTKNGYFFNNIDRGGEFDEADLDARRDFADDFSIMDDATARAIEEKSKKLFDGTEYGIIGMCGGGGFGDVFALPACWLKGEPKGIRKMEDWLMAHLLYPDYILELFELQLEYALKNLEIYRQAVGDRIQAVWIGGTDFGTQNGPFISREQYRALYKPFHQRVNDWVHENTGWKTFYHTCGAIEPLMEDFAQAGIDILNPVQCSASGMDPCMLKEKYGDKFVFWGAGVDTQQVLPFGTPAQVREQVRERLEIFSLNGGYVFSAIHNILGNTPVENLAAMLEAVEEYR